MMFKSEDGVYCKCNLHSSVSIEGGPAFSVNRPVSKSTHTGKRITHNKLANNRNRINGTLNYFIENKNNTNAWRFDLCSILLSSLCSIYLLYFSSIAALYITFQISGQCMALRPSSYKMVYWRMRHVLHTQSI
jgi:hypothetical protein